MSNDGRFPMVPNELRLLSSHIRALLPLHIASLVCISAGTLFGILTPLVLKWIIDQVLPAREGMLLVVAVVLILLSSEGRTAATNFGSYLMLTAAQRMSLSLRMTLLRHLNSLSADYYDRTPLGAVTYPLREPIEEIAFFGSDLLPAIVRTLVTTAFTLVAMSALSPVLTLIIVPFIPAFLFARRHFRKKLTIDSDLVQSGRVAWNDFLEEHLAAAIPIQLLGRQRQQERKAFRLLGAILRSQQQLFRTGVWFTVATSLTSVLAVSAVVAYGGWAVLAGTLSLGSLVAFYTFVAQLFDPLNGAAELYSRTQKVFASIRQVQAVLAVRPSVRHTPGLTRDVPDGPTQVEFVGVEFGYERRKAMLRIPSLRIPPGERLAIVGENGAGKSTLVKLIARVYDVERGSVRIGDEDVRNLRLDGLRRHVCYLPRDPILFDGSLAFNLRFVAPAVSDQELWNVIRQTGLVEFVSSLPNGLHQNLGPRACQFSGGERQRVALARALLQHPQILILDEATSCLDPSSETLVLRNVCSHLNKSTIIVISHRVSTLSIFKRIIVLSAGSIVRDDERDQFPDGSVVNKGGATIHPSSISVSLL